MNVHVEPLPSNAWVGNLVPYQITFDNLSPNEVLDVQAIFRPFIGPPLPMPLPELQISQFVVLKNVAGMLSMQYRGNLVVVELLLHNVKDVRPGELSLYFAPGYPALT